MVQVLSFESQYFLKILYKEDVHYFPQEKMEQIEVLIERFQRQPYPKMFSSKPSNKKSQLNKN
jgi:hypothetical protein